MGDARAGSWLRRFTLTVSQAVTRPRIAFPGPVRAWSPLLFAYGCGVLVMGLWTLLAFVQQPALAGAFPLGIRVVSALVMVSTLGLLVLVGTLVLAGSFAAGLFVAGRRVGLFRYGLRAMAYAQGVMLVCSLLDLAVGGLLSMAGVGPAAGTVVTLIAELLWVAGTLRLAHAAARGLGLSSVRASSRPRADHLDRLHRGGPVRHGPRVVHLTLRVCAASVVGSNFRFFAEPRPHASCTVRPRDA